MTKTTQSKLHASNHKDCSHLIDLFNILIPDFMQIQQLITNKPQVFGNEARIIIQLKIRPRFDNQQPIKYKYQFYINNVTISKQRRREHLSIWVAAQNLMEEVESQN